MIKANQIPNKYYMAAKAYSSANDVYYDNTTTTTAIVQYEGLYPSSKTPLPNLPSYDDTKAAVNFLQNLTTSDT